MAAHIGRSAFVLAVISTAAVAQHVRPTYAQASQNILHVIIIMQENRSFDQYFGTFPGALGPPPGTCVPLNPANPNGGCVAPFHDPHDMNAGGPHSSPDAQVDLDDGITTDKLDGFVWRQTQYGKIACPPGTVCGVVADGIARHDVMGYHTDAEIPNYWAYAQHFVLQDNMFEGVRTWSLPSHLDLASEWVAVCTDPLQAMTCTTDPYAVTWTPGKTTNFPWANLFQLLDVNGVTWKWYLGQGTEPDCEDGAMTCAPQAQQSTVPSIWNPAPYFSSVKAGGLAYITAHNPPIDQFLKDINAGQLPQVSWVVPTNDYSEHPPRGLTGGMEYVTSMVNAVMQSPYWNNTAIFIAWDDWGGFYDHAIPPNVDDNDTKTPIQGYGLRVGGMMISAWARPGLIDSQLLSFDNYAMFFENLFAGGARLDPVQLGNPDNRPDIRDEITQVTFPDGSTAPVGDLLDEFDFTQAPLSPLILSTYIPTVLQVHCRNDATDNSDQCQLATVKIAWEPVTNPQVPGPFTYHIQRDGTELAKCIGTTPHCTDTPGAGNHLYRAYSVDPGGTASPLSAAAEADVP